MLGGKSVLIIYILCALDNRHNVLHLYIAILHLIKTWTKPATYGSHACCFPNVSRSTKTQIVNFFACVEQACSIAFLHIFECWC